MRRFLILLFLSLPAFSQNNAALSPDAHHVFLDTNGRPLAGGRVFTCVAGTTCPGNPKPTYANSSATSQNANPVILNSQGYYPIWLIPGKYKFVVQNAAGAFQWNEDNISAPNAGGQAEVNVKDYGATANGTTDDTAAFNAAISANPGGTITAPPADYNIQGTIEIPVGTSLKLGQGHYYLGNNGYFHMQAQSGGLLNGGQSASLSCPGGRDNTIIIVPATYSNSIKGVITVGSDGSGGGGTIDGCQILFTQPGNASTQGAMTAYVAAAISGQSKGLLMVRNTQITAAWTGIQMNLGASPGKVTISDLRMSAFFIGIDMDYLQDTTRIEKLHYWPWGLTTQQAIAFKNVGNYAMRFGRVDDLELVDNFVYGATAINFYSSPNGATFGQSANLLCDNCNGIIFSQLGDVSFTNTSIGCGPGQKCIQQTAGKIRFLGGTIATFTDVQPPISVTGTSDFTVSGCRLSFGGTDLPQIVLNSNSANVIFTGNTIDKPQPVGTSYVNPVISVTNLPKLVFANNVITTPLTLGQHSAFMTIQSNITGTMHDNLFGTWAVAQGAPGNLLVHDNVELGTP